MQHPESDKMARILAESYKALHEQGRFSRRDYPYQGLFQALLDAVPDGLPVLDYGCGPAGGIGGLGRKIVPYDPYVPQYAGGPWVRPYAAVHSSDVLEHMLVPDVVAFLDAVKANGPALVFLVIATRPAHKVLSNGVNVHLTIMEPAWWYGVVQSKLDGYDPVLAWGDFLEDVCILAFRKRASAAATP